MSICISRTPCLTLGANRRSPTPGVVWEAGSLGVPTEFIGLVAHILQSDEDIIGSIDQEVVPMCWLGWQTAHSFHWHWKQKEKKKTGFLEVAPLLLSTICTISGAVCLECGDKQMTFSQFTSLSYHTLVQRHSMCRLSGRWQNERLAVRSRGRNGK